MNIAFAGFRHGHIFMLYNEAVENELVTVTGSFEGNDEVRESVRTERGVDFCYSTYEEILNDERVDVIGIGDYYAKRGQMIIAALRHGKHVICDKPICTTLAELDEIEALVKSTGLSVQAMLELRFMPQATLARDMIARGEIGKVLNASFTAQHHLAYGTRPGWYFEEGKHGGTINDIAVHGVDLMRYMTGKNLTKIHHARTWNAFADKEPNFKDSAQFTAEMDGMALMADVSYAAPKCPGLPSYWDIYLWGTEGMINFKYADSSLYIYKNEKKVFSCDAPRICFIGNLEDELCGKDALISTAETLASSRQTLLIQDFADKEQI